MRLWAFVMIATLGFGAYAKADVARTLRPIIDRELHRAAAETGVPYPLLAGIALLESHWTMVHPMATAVATVGNEDEHAPIFGVMGLRDDSWFGSSLIKASRLV